MMSFGYPLALWGLLALPVFWWLLRAMPPEPVRQFFPPLRLLLGLETDAAIPDTIPVWLRILRLLGVAAMVLAIAQPVWNQKQTPVLRGHDPLLIIMDDGWAAAPSWDQRVRAARALLAQAAQEKRPAVLVFASDGETQRRITGLSAAGQLQKEVGAHAPVGYAPDREKLLHWLQSAKDGGALPPHTETVWIASNLDTGHAGEWMQGLADFGPIKVMGLDAVGPLMLQSVHGTPDGLMVSLQRQSGSGAWNGELLARDGNGQIIFRQSAHLDAGTDHADIAISLPLELRNRIRAIRVAGAKSAASVFLLDRRWERPKVGLIGGNDPNRDRPLLSQRFYLQKALDGMAQVQDLNPDQLPDDLPPVLVLLDSGLNTQSEMDALEKFVQQGGLLIRFAGPRLAAHPDALLPVPLRKGARQLGSAMGWETPQQLASFPKDSPFYGLDADIAANVRRQVLAEAGPGLSTHVWASLADGTPLVTSARRGKGRVVLFHVSAAPDQSDLPLSGLFVSMLKRLLPLAKNANVDSAQDFPAGLELQQRLDGFGQLVGTQGASGVLEKTAAETAPSAQYPPGLWARNGAMRARNALDHVQITPLPPLPAGWIKAGLAARPPILLAPWIWIGLLVLLALDSLIMLAHAGRLSWPAPKQARNLSGMVLLLLCLPWFFPTTVRAQEPTSPYAMLDKTRLAYVVTGDARIDAMSAAGLRGLTNVLNERTTVEPGKPAAIHLDRDDLHVVSFLYWPVMGDVQLSEPVRAKLDNYMKDGGMLVVDTQDGGLRAAKSETGIDPALQSLFNQLDLPRLQRVPPDHVLTHTYYLLHDFPGRYEGGAVWVEADRSGSSLDGVSSLIVGSADWAAAWAVNANDQPIAGLSNEIPNQREMARRFGINLVMYALAGNYKADQVHVPELLRRMGQEP